MHEPHRRRSRPRRSIGRAFVVVLSTLGLTGCWLQPGFDATRSNWNRSETALTAATVGDLVELWDVQVPTATQVHDPISDRGTIYVTAGTNRSDSGKVITALDGRSGTPRWTIDLVAEGLAYPEGFTADPVWFDDELIVLYTRHYRSVPAWTRLAHVDPATGGIVADEDVPGTGVPAVADDTLAVPRTTGAGTGQPGRAWISWKYEALLFSGTLDPNDAGGGFAIAGDRILTSYGTRALGFSPACPPPPPTDTGCAPDWSTELDATYPPSGVTALGLDGVVYTTYEVIYQDDGTRTIEGTVHVLDAATGATRWTATVGAAIDRPAAVAGDTILVTTRDGRLLALPAEGCGAATCEPRWEASVGARPDAPVAGGDVAYVADETGRISAFPVEGCGAPTCAPLVTVDTGSLVTGGPIVDDGRLVAGLQDGRVVAYGLPG